MLRRVRVVDVGDTTFLVDEQVERHLFEEQNERVMSKWWSACQGEPLLLRYYQGLSLDGSFISASSFQETTKVLTEAAIQGKVDYLRGLKENVIMGRLIPAGTGIPTYKRLTMVIDDPDRQAITSRSDGAKCPDADRSPARDLESASASKT